MAYAHHARIETNQTAGVGVSIKPGGNLLPLPRVQWEGGSLHGYEEGGSATKESFTKDLGAGGSNILRECARSRQCPE